MSKNNAEKRAIKRQLLIERTALALQITPKAAEQLLQTPRVQSVRINPLKGDAATTLQELASLGWRGQPVAWAPNCYTSQDAITIVRDSDAAQDGRAFIQNAASWLPVLALAPQPGDTVLDICAAPGGKTSHIAAASSNQAVITANDNSRPRLAKMRANFERLGVNANTTLYDATQLAKKLGDTQFDKILLDAPCSGEGMMHLQNAKDFDTWSVAQIKRLQQLQKRLIGQAWQLLKPGGTLVYSTCTMAPEENEAVISYLLRNQPDAAITPFDAPLQNRVKPVASWNDKPFDPRTQACLRLAPSPQVEAFFVCKLTKLVAA